MLTRKKNFEFVSNNFTIEIRILLPHESSTISVVPKRNAFEISANMRTDIKLSLGLCFDALALQLKTFLKRVVRESLRIA